jgi:hypothetical protein
MMSAMSWFSRRLFGLTPLDYFITAGAIAVILAFSSFAYGGTGAHPRVIIEGEQGSWVYPLETSQALVVHGPVGTTRIQLKEGAIRVLESDCRDKLCVNFGPARHGGDWIACLPNRVFIRVESGAGAGESGVDASSF